MELNQLGEFIKIIIALLICMILLWYVLIPFVRHLKEPFPYPERQTKNLLANQETSLPTLPPTETTPTSQEILELAKKDPAKTAFLIQRWLKDKNMVE